jgi:hypothetical protein
MPFNFNSTEYKYLADEIRVRIANLAENGLNTLPLEYCLKDMLTNGCDNIHFALCSILVDISINSDFSMYNYYCEVAVGCSNRFELLSSILDNWHKSPVINESDVEYVRIMIQDHYDFFFKNEIERAEPLGEMIKPGHSSMGYGNNNCISYGLGFNWRKAQKAMSAKLSSKNSAAGLLPKDTTVWISSKSAYQTFISSITSLPENEQAQAHFHYFGLPYIQLAGYESTRLYCVEYGLDLSGKLMTHKPNTSLADYNLKEIRKGMYHGHFCSFDESNSYYLRNFGETVNLDENIFSGRGAKERVHENVKVKFPQEPIAISGIAFKHETYPIYELLQKAYERV